MTWTTTIREALPEVARRAGSRTVESLQVRLEHLAAEERIPTDPPGVALSRLLPRLTREMVVLEHDTAELSDVLAIARAQGTERAALVEVLTRLDPPELDRDLLALERHLDAEALEDRLLLHRHAAHQEWEYLAHATASRSGDLDADTAIACRDAGIEVLRGARRPWSLRVAACRLAGELAHHDLPGAPSTRQALLEQAHVRGDDPWVRAASLSRWLDLQPDPDVVERVLRTLLDDREQSPFFRARVAVITGVHGAWPLLRRHLDDPSDHVACTVARTLARSPREGDRTTLWARVRTGRDTRTVAASAVVAALPDPTPGEEATVRLPKPDDALRAVEAGLAADDPWVAERAARAALDRLEALADQAAAALDLWGDDLDRLTEEAEGDLRITAATLRLALQVHADPPRRDALQTIRAWTRDTGEGARRTFGTGPVAALDPGALLEVLAVAAAEGFDLSAALRGGDPWSDEPPRRGYRLFHGARPAFASWRAAYELRRPRPDKRQAHSFLTDRVPQGALYAPSLRLAEVTPTEVPGQRQSSPTELDWGSELPLPAVVLAAAREGGLRVRAPHVAFDLHPKGPALLARARAHRHYTDLAALRRRLLTGGGADAQPTYDAALDRAGFEIRRALAALPIVRLDELASHLVALDSNTVPQLAALSAVLLAGWAGRSLARRRQERQWRQSIPLVIGGWGSRGKSGTERLKAGLFHGLGYTVLSKTTGNEAMVVSGIPGRESTEIFLYRPYDKATIFEQRDVLALAAELRPQVFLWECMALRPYYVDILQGDWVKDDLTTITNTYPDHEDIQGPTGRDVAETIARFVPEGGTVVTSEQHMTPVLERRATEAGARLYTVRPEEWELLPQDLLDRFPYREHPRNIALVARLAGSLGIRRDVALRAMADHVVPDLGVLKEYGPTDYEGREASYVCGNSANERAGFLGNWTRMDLDEGSDSDGLDRFTILQVNNRADRLSRQQVFARIAALDVAFDALVVIGTNVEPFVTAWQEVLRGELAPRLRDRADDREALARLLARQLRRRPLERPRAWQLAVAAGADAEAADARTRALWAPDRHPDALGVDLVAHPPRTGRPLDEAVEQWLLEAAWIHHLHRRDDWSPEAAIDAAVAVIASRGVPLRDPDLSGDQVLERTVRCAPPGARTRVFGAANIKGTGLDHVYRWLAIDKVRTRLDELVDADAEQARTLIRALASRQDPGVADTRIAVRQLEAYRSEGRFQAWDLGDEGDKLLEQLRGRLQALEAALDVESGQSLAQRFQDWLAEAVDFRYSIQRRREADQLYADLAARRVGQSRAATLAKDLVYRDKL